MHFNLVPKYKNSVSNTIAKTILQLNIPRAVNLI